MKLNFILRVGYSAVPRWSFFSRLGNNRFLRELSKWFVLVPIATRLLIMVAREFGAGSTTIFVSQLSLPYDWQLLYYAAFVVMIASLAYELRAPAILKDYGSYLTLAGRDLSARTLVDYFLSVLGNGRLRRRSRDAVIELLHLADDPRSYVVNDATLDTVPSAEKILHNAHFEDQIRPVQRYVWDQCDHARIWSRLTCLLLYFLSFFFLVCAFLSDLHLVWTQSSGTNLLNHLLEIVGLEG